jgi:putative FmdB family regulatory protein
MPTYEYECPHCGYRFDKFQGIKDRPILKCPRCGEKTRRLIGTGAGVIFKSSGSREVSYDRPVPAACNRSQPCCGRDTPCDKRPCES